MQWDVVRHQVAIAGTVTDSQTEEGILAAQIRITAAPDALIARLTTWAKSATLHAGPPAVRLARTTLDDPNAGGRQKLEAAQVILNYLQTARRETVTFDRPDLSYSAADGHFHFLDLPDGTYELTVSLPKAGTRYGATRVPNLQVSSEGQGVDRNITMAVADIRLSPTTILGEIKNADNEAVFFAKVRLQGSDKSAISDEMGKYRLLKLEATRAGATENRQIKVTARGYQENLVTIGRIENGDVQTLDFAMTSIPNTP